MVMNERPTDLLAIIEPFAPLFTARVWSHARVLLIGAILAPGTRAVAAALRIMSLDHERCFHKYHRVLSRARWSTLGASRRLLALLIDAFAPEGSLVMGPDDTLERRRGPKIADLHHKQEWLKSS
jgi:hypothetical protein